MSPFQTIHEHEWEFYGAAALPLYISIYPPFYTFGFQERYGTPVDVINVYDGKRVFWYMKAEQLNEIALRVLPTLLKEQWGFFDRWQEELKTFEECHKKLMDTDLAKLSDTELSVLMREYREAFGKPFVTNNIIEGVSFYFQNRLVELLQKEQIDTERAVELMQLYGQAARPSYLKLAAQAYRNAVEDERENVLAEYHYIFTDYAGVKPVTHENLSELERTTPFTYAEELRSEGVSEVAQALLSVMQIIATIQDLRKGGFLQMCYAAQEIGEEFSRRSGIAYELVECATWDELENSTVTAEELRARKNGLYAFYWTLDGVTSIVGEEAKDTHEKLNAHIFKHDDEQREVKGICASKGKATGRVVVVFEKHEFDKVQQGDILVTVMTRPEFLPVMHKAAAFVCDEGGLTSHAAIVAREMKKPCIIATKVGTRVFKDGDMVEVDANTGVVRKLSV